MLLFFLLSVCLGLVVSPEVKDVRPNPLYERYWDTKNAVFTVNTFDELKTRDLLKYGVVRVKSTNSIISSQLLAEEAFDPNYLPKYEYEEEPEVDSAAFASAADLSDRRRTAFYEVSFAESTYTKETTSWMPITSCYTNKLSSGSATYSQGYTLSVTSSVSAHISFARLFGMTPGFSAGINFSAEVGGSLSCDVNPRQTVQFQVMTESITVKGLRQRKIKIKGDYMYTNGFFASMQPEDWEDVEEFTELNSQNVQTACVTDPEYLICSE